MLPCSKLQVELLSVVEQILITILFFSFEEVSEVLDGVAPEVVRVTSVQKSLFPFLLIALSLMILLLLLKSRADLGQALLVDINQLFYNIIFQGSWGNLWVEGFGHRLLRDRQLVDWSHDVREHFFDLYAT